MVDSWLVLHRPLKAVVSADNSHLFASWHQYDVQVAGEAQVDGLVEAQAPANEPTPSYFTRSLYSSYYKHLKDLTWVGRNKHVAMWAKSSINEVSRGPTRQLEINVASEAVDFSSPIRENQQEPVTPLGCD